MKIAAQRSVSVPTLCPNFFLCQCLAWLQLLRSCFCASASAALVRSIDSAAPHCGTRSSFLPPIFALKSLLLTKKWLLTRHQVWYLSWVIFSWKTEHYSLLKMVMWLLVLTKAGLARPADQMDRMGFVGKAPIWSFPQCLAFANDWNLWEESRSITALDSASLHI